MRRPRPVVLAAGVALVLAAVNVVEFSLNVALFVPGALAAALLWPRVRWWQWVVTGLAITASIETLQAVFLDSRTPQVRDLVSNTLGAALGSGAAVRWHRARGAAELPASRGI